MIKPEQIEALSIDEIRLLNNEIFARNGYRFENPRFQQFFAEKPWYHPVNDNKSIVYNTTEKQNIKLFQERTGQLKVRQEAVVTQLKDLKTLVMNGKITELKSKYNFSYEPQYSKEESELLKRVFQKVNVDDIHYYKNKGLHSVTVDNGFVKIVYEIAIENNKINLFYNYMAHSKIIANFDVFTDYHSEEEYMYNWQFEFTNNKLQFIRLAIAG